MPDEGILPGADQDYLGRGSEECSESRGVLPEDGSEDRDREPVPWGFRWRRSGVGDLAG